MSSKFNRRSFIKGLGAATGLAAGFAGSSVARGATQQAPLRVLLVGLQHGWGRDLELGRKFTGSEFDFTIPSPLTGFKEIQDQVVFVDGARGTFWANAHDVSYADMFTAGVFCKDERTHGAFTTSQTPSLDYVLAKHANKPAFRINAKYRSWGERNLTRSALTTTAGALTLTMTLVPPTMPSSVPSRATPRRPCPAETPRGRISLNTLDATPTV